MKNKYAKKSIEVFSKFQLSHKIITTFTLLIGLFVYSSTHTILHAQAAPKSSFYEEFSKKKAEGTKAIQDRQKDREAAAVQKGNTDNLKGGASSFAEKAAQLNAQRQQPAASNTSANSDSLQKNASSFAEKARLVKICGKGNECRGDGGKRCLNLEKWNYCKATCGSYEGFRASDCAKKAKSKGFPD